MSTEILCPECGGVIFATGAEADANRACTCAERGSAAAVVGATPEVAAPAPAGKICVNCGADVMNARRLKDKDGNYWCVNCGIEDSRRKKEAEIKAGGGGAVCPDCCGRFPKDKMIRAGADLICEACGVKRVASSKKGGKKLAVTKSFAPGAGVDHTARNALIVIVILLAIVLAWQFLI